MNNLKEIIENKIHKQKITKINQFCANSTLYCGGATRVCKNCKSFVCRNCINSKNNKCSFCTKKNRYEFCIKCGHKIKKIICFWCDMIIKICHSDCYDAHNNVLRFMSGLNPHQINFHKKCYDKFIQSQ